MARDPQAAARYSQPRRQRRDPGVVGRREEAGGVREDGRAALTAAGGRDRLHRPLDTRGAGATAVAIVTPDASVLLKWVLPGDDEQDTDAALALRDEAAAGALDLVVPQLWIYEVGNTLARRFPDDADELLASLADFGLTEARLDSRWKTRAVSLAVTYEVAFYDAAYHAVALGLGGVFVTADERYVRRASRAGGISSLRSWQTR